MTLTGAGVTAGPAEFRSAGPRALTAVNGTRLSSAPAVGKKRPPGSAEMSVLRARMLMHSLT